MRKRHRLVLLTAAPALLIGLGTSCGGEVSGPSAPVVATVELSGVATLLVNEWTLLTVVARDSRGQVISHPPHPAFSSTDATVLAVTGSGAVHGLRRGSAAISVQVGGVRAATQINVRARLRFSPGAYDRYPDGDTLWTLGIGDTVQLAARYVDVDGVPIAELPVVAWSSDAPAVADVAPDGNLVAAAPGTAHVRAFTEDDATSVVISVQDFGSQLATIRFAHALKGVGPVTFLPNKGDSVTLTYGQSVERTIAPGLFVLQTWGLPIGDPWAKREYYDLIHGGDRVTVYAVGGQSQGYITAAFSSTQGVPSDSGRVRLVQGWSPFEVVYLRATGAPPTGLPELCYFDPTEVSGYYSLAPGGFDVILQEKYGGTAAVRLAANVAAGRAVTLVLAGSTAAEMEILTFIDQ